jgi:UDP-glucose 4-epimerase
MKVLITGGQGLVGSNLFEKLSKEHDVFIPLFDLKDSSYTNHYFQEVRPDVVYHLAANAAEARGQISPIDMTQNNIGIFVNVLRAAINANVKRFIYTSSVAVYGETAVPYKETNLTIPKDVYGINKLACEQILQVMAKVYGFEYVILRPHNIYGPNQNMADPYRNVVALFMRKLLTEEPYKLFGEGQMRRQFSYVDDVVDVLIKSLTEFAGETMNVGSDKDISIKELSDILQKVSGKTSKVELLPARKQEISMFLADHSLQNSITDYKETPLEEGLKTTWQWVLSQPLPELIKKENEIYV